MCYRTACIALVISTLNTKLASPVSRRDALYAELASLARKYINTPVRLEDRVTGSEETKFTQRTASSSLCPIACHVHIVPFSAEQGTRQNKAACREVAQARVHWHSVPCGTMEYHALAQASMRWHGVSCTGAACHSLPRSPCNGAAS
jgi:hypothetical protein